MVDEKTLKDLCKVVKYEDESSFVGIKSGDGDTLVYFPLGYRLSETDDEIRRDILQLITILNEFNKREGEIPEKKYDETVEDEFPITAYMEIIHYYLENGYYTEVEPVYKTRQRGKINWSKTIKQQRPFLLLNNDNSTYSPIYTNFTVKQSDLNENKEITRIHQYCVRESFEKIGCLFTSFMPPKAEITFNKDRFLTILHSKLANTNNDNKKRLFNSMIEMIGYMDEDEPNKNIHFGTNYFEHVWEGLIDNAFGTEKKEDYYPYAHWILLNDEIHTPTPPLQPDSIMCAKNKDNIINYFVLDAKYYQYGDSGNDYNLPRNADINKQITYAEYLERIIKEINPNNIYNAFYPNNIYNAFLIPFNKEGDKFPSDEPFFNIGTAVSDWKKNKKNYEYIQGILVDTKFLMDSYRSKSTENIKKLAEAIEDACKENKERYERNKDIL